MSNFDQSDLNELVQYEVNLDISGFVRGAVKDKMNRDTILLYLFMVSQTYGATDKMRQFFPVAQEHDLSRNEILIWLHLSYGGSENPKHISRKLRIPPRFVENALAALKEKGIISWHAIMSAYHLVIMPLCHQTDTFTKSERLVSPPFSHGQQKLEESLKLASRHPLSHASRVGQAT